MAVYTKINKKDILFLSKKFSLGKIIKFYGIKCSINYKSLKFRKIWENLILLLLFWNK